jgi:hypothetical protein
VEAENDETGENESDDIFSSSGGGMPLHPRTPAKGVFPADHAGAPSILLDDDDDVRLVNDARRQPLE